MSLVLLALFLPHLFACAVVHYTPKLLAMVTRILRSAPDAGNTELAAATAIVVVRAEHPSPRMGTTFFDHPAVFFGILDRGFNIRFRMLASSHGCCRLRQEV